MRLPGSLRTAFVAAALLVPLDLLAVLLVEREQAVGYFALTSGLVLFPMLLVGVVFARVPRPLAATAAGLVGLAGALLSGLVAGLAAGASLFVLLRLFGRASGEPAHYGVAAGAANAGVALFAFPDGGSDALLCVVGVAIAFAIVVACERAPVAGRRRAIPLLVAAATVVCVAIPALTESPAPPDRRARAPGPAGDPEKPHVLLVVLDTVRADHTSVHGYERDTTPRLAERAASHPGAAVFPSFFANSSWTLPSHASLFTGLRPGEHGAHFRRGGDVTRSIGEHPTLAERMREAGYLTIGVYANPWLGVRGMRRGFDVSEHPAVATRLPRVGEAARRLLVPGAFAGVVHTAPRGGAVLGVLERELGACDDRPCFAFVNLMEAHALYAAESCAGKYADWSLRERLTSLSIHDPPERTAHLEARYDEEICELDRLLDGLFERLDARGFLERAWVFVTADHGEAFGTHGATEHGSSVYNDQTWIPLVVLPPAGASIAATDEPGSLVDLTATIAAIGGAAPLGQGRDLRQSAATGGTAAIEFYGDPSKVASQNPLAAEPARAIVTREQKLVEQAGRTQLFELDDREEQRDRSAERPEAVARLRALLPELRLDDDADVRDEALPEEVRRRLEALGYLK